MTQKIEKAKQCQGKIPSAFFLLIKSPAHCEMAYPNALRFCIVYIYKKHA